MNIPSPDRVRAELDAIKKRAAYLGAYTDGYSDAVEHVQEMLRDANRAELYDAWAGDDERRDAVRAAAHARRSPIVYRRCVKCGSESPPDGWYASDEGDYCSRCWNGRTL